MDRKFATHLPTVYEFHHDDESVAPSDAETAIYMSGKPAPTAVANPSTPPNADRQMVVVPSDPITAIVRLEHKRTEAERNLAKDIGTLKALVEAGKLTTAEEREDAKMTIKMFRLSTLLQGAMHSNLSAVVDVEAFSSRVKGLVGQHTDDDGEEKKGTGGPNRVNPRRRRLIEDNPASFFLNLAEGAAAAMPPPSNNRHTARKTERELEEATWNPKVIDAINYVVHTINNLPNPHVKHKTLDDLLDPPFVYELARWAGAEFLMGRIMSGTQWSKDINYKIISDRAKLCMAYFLGYRPSK